MLGVSAALGPTDWVASLFLAVLILTVTMIPPLAWVGLTLLAVVPFQLYLSIPGTSFTLRGSVVFMVLAAFRVLIDRTTRIGVQPSADSTFAATTRESWWKAAVGLFILAATAAALTAPSRYLALKGVMDWASVFGVALVMSEIVRSERTLKSLVGIVIAVGVVQALVGLAQYAMGLEAVLTILRLPISSLFYLPDLLREKLVDGSFNWIVFNRATPFGTFINGIDFAIYAAAVLSLVLALLLEREPSHMPPRSSQIRLGLLIVSALLVATALFLTLKGTGLVALGGGLAALASCYLALRNRQPETWRRLSRRAAALAPVAVIVAAFLLLPFADVVWQRAQFLVLRELGTFGTAGRTEIWASLFQSFVERPVFGFGLNNAVLLAEPMRTLQGGAFTFNPTNPESLYVTLLIETGVVGLAALLGLIGMVLVRAYRNAQQSPAAAAYVGILAAIAALLFGNLTVSGLIADQNGMLFGAFVGMVFSKWE